MPPTPMKQQKLRDIGNDLIFGGPAFLVFAAIVLSSFVIGIYYSFTEWNGVDKEALWIGLDNYVKLLTDDPEALKSALFTLRFTIATVILANILAFTLALALTLALKSAKVMRTIFFLPNVIGGIILGFVWRFIFTNSFITLGDITGFGFFEYPWLGTPSTGFWGAVIVFIWQRTGYLMVIYIAAMMNIDEHLLEAARIDGASGVQMLKRMIVPLTMPAVTVCLFLALSWSTKMFDVIFSLTEGGPFRSTETFAINIYYEAFRYNNYGAGSAKAIVFFIVVGLLTTIQVLVTKKREIEG